MQQLRVCSHTLCWCAHVGNRQAWQACCLHRQLLQCPVWFQQFIEQFMGQSKRQHPVASSIWLQPLLCLKLWYNTCTGITSRALQHAGDVYALQASWMPLGVDWTAAFRACPAVTEYILVRSMRNARGFKVYAAVPQDSDSVVGRCDTEHLLAWAAARAIS